MSEKIDQILDELSKPFHPSRITWRPGALTGKKDKALALAYADLRAYQNRLDETCGMDWAVSYTPWGDRIICHLTINGITRSSTGEADSDSERSEIAGTSAEAQAFKRACAMFGLGRYLYTLPSLWVEYDAPNQRFTEKTKARLHNIIAQHYQRFLNGVPTTALDAPAEEAPEDVQVSSESSQAVAEAVQTTEAPATAETIRQAEGEPVRQAKGEAVRPAAPKNATKQVKEAPAPTNGTHNGTQNGAHNGASNGVTNGASNGATSAEENGDSKDEALSPLRKKLDELGKELYGEQWTHVRAHNIKRLVGEQNDGNATLSKEQIQTLINGLKKLKQQRQAA